jgi:plasmid stability protein
MTTTSETPEDIESEHPGASGKNLTREEARAELNAFLARPEMAKLLDGVTVELRDPQKVDAAEHLRPVSAEERKFNSHARSLAESQSAALAAVEAGESLEFPPEPDSALETLESLLERLTQTVRVLKKSLAPQTRWVKVPVDELDGGVTE